MSRAEDHRTARERTTIALERMLADLTSLEVIGSLVARDRRAAIEARPTSHSRDRLASAPST